MKTWRPLLGLLIVLLISACLLAGDSGPMSSTSFVVLKDESGKPIRNAAVILHPVEKNGKQAKSGFELKTNEDGETHFDGIPYGLLRVQVIAHGFQTFGEDFQINQPDQKITIRLKRPQRQYSIYESHEKDQSGTATTNGGSSPPPDKQP